MGVPLQRRQGGPCRGKCGIGPAASGHGSIVGPLQSDDGPPGSGQAVLCGPHLSQRLSAVGLGGLNCLPIEEACVSHPFLTGNRLTGKLLPTPCSSDLSLVVAHFEPGFLKLTPGDQVFGEQPLRPLQGKGIGLCLRFGPEPFASRLDELSLRRLKGRLGEYPRFGELLLAREHALGALDPGLGLTELRFGDGDTRPLLLDIGCRLLYGGLRLSAIGQGCVGFGVGFGHLGAVEDRQGLAGSDRTAETGHHPGDPPWSRRRYPDRPCRIRLEGSGDLDLLGDGCHPGRFDPNAGNPPGFGGELDVPFLSLVLVMPVGVLLAMGGLRRRRRRRAAQEARPEAGPEQSSSYGAQHGNHDAQRLHRAAPFFCVGPSPSRLGSGGIVPLARRTAADASAQALRAWM